MITVTWLLPAVADPTETGCADTQQNHSVCSETTACSVVVMIQGAKTSKTLGLPELLK